MQINPDASNHKNSEQSIIIDTEKRYRALFENAKDAIFIMEVDKFVECNTRTLEMFGSTYEQIIGKTLYDPYSPEFQPDGRKSKEKVLEKIHLVIQGQPQFFEWTHTRYDGSTFYAEVSLNKLEISEKVFVQAIVRDITERKVFEKEMKQSEQTARAFLEATTDSGLLVDREGLIIDLNERMASALRGTRKDMIGKVIYDYLPHDVAEQRKAKSLVVINKREPIRFEDQREDRWFENSVYPILDPGGEVYRFAIFSRDITERKKSEEALRAERDKLQALMDGINRAGIGIDIVGSDYRVLFQNKALEDIFGKLTGKQCFEHFKALKEPCEQCSVAEAIKEKKAVSMEQKGFNGRDYQVFSAPLPDTDGTVSKAIEIIVDITEHKQFEEYLKEEKDKAQKYLDVAGVMFVLIDKEGKVNLVNKKGCEILRYNESEIIGTNWFDIFLPKQNRENVKEVFHELMAGEIEQVEYFENPVLTKDGEERLIAWHNTILRDNLGNIAGTLSSGTDITESKKAEAAMKKSSIIIDSTTDAVVTTDTAGNITFWNKGAETIYGYRKEEAIGKPISIIYKDEDLHVLESMIADLMEGKEIPGIEVTCIDKNRRDVEILLSLMTIKDKNGNITELVGITKDITERKQAEEKLRESEERYRSIIEDQTEFIVRWKPDGVRTFVNDSYCRYFGKSREELIGSSFFSLISEKDREKVRNRIDSIDPDNPVSSDEHQVIRPDGSIGWNLWTDRAIFDEEGRLKEFQSVGRDITERRKSQKMLLDYQKKLKSLTSELSLAEERERRRIAAGLHDDIAQKLAIAKLSLQSLQASMTDIDLSQALEKQCELMDQIVEDARTLTFELSNPILYQVGLEAAVESHLVKQIQDEFGLECKFKSEDPRSSLSDDIKAVLFQAVREILANVIKHANASTVEVHITNSEDELKIVIKDDGVGFNAAQIGSQGSGEGGFGLFNIKERLEYLGGNFRIESRLKNGTRVFMSVPINNDAVVK